MHMLVCGEYHLILGCQTQLCISQLTNDTPTIFGSWALLQRQNTCIPMYISLSTVEHYFVSGLFFLAYVQHLSTVVV